MSAGAVVQERMSLDAFQEWYAAQPGKTKYEYVDGFVYPKYGRFESGKWHDMGLDNVTHNRAKGRAAIALIEAKKAAGMDHCFVSLDGVQVRVSENQTRIPDAFLDCGDIKGDDYFAKAPVVIIEVVSRTSVHRDVFTKYWEYFNLDSVYHYLVIFPRDRKIVHHSRQGDGVASRILTTGEIKLAPPGITLSADFLLDENA